MGKIQATLQKLPNRKWLIATGGSFFSISFTMSSGQSAIRRENAVLSTGELGLLNR
jgi:hypothetical protein